MIVTERLSSVEIDGYTIGYREAGQGSEIVLLHGFLCDSRCWRRQLAGLSHQFRVIAWDAPGAGSSADPPETFTTADYVRCLAAFFDAVGIARAHIVGLSWGGILAQEFFRLYPERVRSLVLADTYAGWRGSLPEPLWRERLAACLRDSTGPAHAVVAKLTPGMFTDGVSEGVREELSAIMSEFHPVGFRVMARSSAEVDTRDLLTRIRVPTLVVWGDDDRRSPVHIAEHLRSAIPSAHLVILRGAGHVSNMEKPEEFNAHVGSFCRSLEDGPDSRQIATTPL
jgi:pimeloyl-ACP methyl ester carboxylesterase